VPVTRHAARVLVVDEEGRVLLLFGRDATLADDPGWWITPGGGVDGDESLADAAIREVFEETGCRLAAVTGPIGERDTAFQFEGIDIHQLETFYSARVEHFEPRPSGWTEIELRTLLAHRWWTETELAETGETVYPENLLELLHRARQL
jgi:8-oxo-dGTP pyrophosphatase MutT (NUDIX family)